MNGGDDRLIPNATDRYDKIDGWMDGWYGMMVLGMDGWQKMATDLSDEEIKPSTLLPNDDSLR